MKLSRAIDFRAGSYRRVFQDLLSGAEGEDWCRVERRGLLCLNHRTLPEFPADIPAGQRVHYCGVESDEAIRRVFAKANARASVDIVFVARIDQENLYRFGTSMLDLATVLFILDYVPKTVEDRNHAFNLFHKSLLLRRIGSLLHYYDRVVEMLTAVGPLPASPPDLLDSLGSKSLLYQCGVLRERIWRKYDLWYRHSKRRASANAPKSQRKSLKDCQRALITGWYGTETAGDKAILQELIHVLREKTPGIKISITSIVPGLSRLTNLEIGLDADVLDLRSLDYRKLGSVELVVFGGGPLMDSSALKYIEILFAWARRRGLATLVFGCGVGPLKTDLGIARVKSILRNTDHAFFRDERSADMARELGFCGPKLYACDPAMRYVVRWRDRQAAAPADHTREQLVTLLRAQTNEYSARAGTETDRLRDEVLRFIRSFLNGNAEREVVMLPMHTFWLGNDDRDYISRIVGRIPQEMRLKACKETLLLDGLLERISKARWGLPMRFHGHVFMLALNIPFVSIDYTGAGGKVGNLIEHYGLADYSVSVVDASLSGEIRQRWKDIRTHADEIQVRVREQLEKDLLGLEKTYRQLFGERAGQDRI